MDQFGRLRQELARQLPQLELREQEPMCSHTSFRVGGPAALMALPKPEEVTAMLHIAAEQGIVPFFMGKGSNLLVSDAGIAAFVVKTAGSMKEIRKEDDCILYADSGISMAQAAIFAAENGLTGMEFAHGIPGTVGGGVFMNAGAYGGEMMQVVEWVDCLDEAGVAHRKQVSDLEFAYRHSVFSKLPWLITGARFALKPGDPGGIRKTMRELMERRREKQPLEYPSAGSTFKRPVGHFAGGLIEQCGLKGKTIGGAQVSEKHAGFLINTGHATCGEILQLIQFVQETVERETGVLLEPEIRMLGCSL